MRAGPEPDSTRNSLAQLHKRLTALETGKSPFENPPRGADARGVHWVHPQLVAEVSFAQWTKERVVRQAVFHGLRTDKPRLDDRLRKGRRASPEKAICSAEQKKYGVKVRSAGSPVARQGEQSNNGCWSAMFRSATRTASSIPASGLTKLDVALYYERIAPAILPHLENRPVSLVRVPERSGRRAVFPEAHGQRPHPGGEATGCAARPGASAA